VPIPLPSSFRRTWKRLRAPKRILHLSCLLVTLGIIVTASGCKRFNHEQHDSVYVAARQIYLHDRVAAVSERVAMVSNGQKLEVLDRNRRFIKVKTEKNEIGWIEERAVIDDKTYQEFAKLAEDHRQDPKATTATLRDDLYMHVVPGRDSDHLYLLPGNAKVELLARASAPKVGGPGAPKPVVPAKPAAPAKEAASTKPAMPAKPGTSGAAQPDKKKADGTAGEQLEAPAPAMEDWWLARDSQGRVGWLLASRLDVDVPDEVAQYGENQRFIGCWMLTKVTDPDSDKPNHQVPVYLTVMAPNKSGLPFDFDQVRVFTWSVKHHRYETGFRLHPIQGFLPVRVGTQQTPKGPLPTFSFQLAGTQDVVTDPATGITRPANPRTINYQLIDNSAKRVGPDMASIYLMHESDKKDNAAQKAAKKKHK
jgi:hypothetical protein